MLFQRCIFLSALALPLLHAHVLIEKDVSESVSPTTTAPPTAYASSSAEQYCYPAYSIGDTITAPCILIANISTLCTGGPGEPAPSPAEEQKCYCGTDGQGSNYWELLAGCFNCFRLHGAPLGDQWYPIQYIPAQSSSYCALPAPTEGFGDFIGNWTASSGIDIGTSTGGVDVLGTSTQADLYFTSTPITGGSVAASTTPAVSNTETASGGAAASSKSISAGLLTSTTTGPSATVTSSSNPATTSHSGGNGLGVSGLLGAVVLGVVCLL